MSCCTFCGHHDTSERIRPLLREKLIQLIEENGVDNFLIGNNGQFDSMALGVIRELTNQYPKIRYSVVLAYLPIKKEEYSPYSEEETLYPDGLETVPQRFAITHRNRWMADCSDFIISYVKKKYGGAYQTLRYAKNKRLKIIEL